MLSPREVVNEGFTIYFYQMEFLRNYPKEIYYLLAANSLVTQMMPECQNGEGLLGAMLAEGIEYKDAVRIVADLFLAAGDTVSECKGQIEG
jgi:hypothetical protein